MVTIIEDKKVNHVEDGHHGHINFSRTYCQEHTNLSEHSVFRKENCVDELMRRLMRRKGSLSLDN